MVLGALSLQGSEKATNARTYLVSSAYSLLREGLKIFRRRHNSDRSQEKPMGSSKRDIVIKETYARAARTARTAEQGRDEPRRADVTATTGFQLNDDILSSLERQVHSPQDFAVKFVEIVERTLDLPPDRREWQTYMVRLKDDAENLFGN